MDDDAVALRLGRLVIASARLELELKQVAEFLGEPNGRGLSQLQQMKAIRRRARDRPDGEEIEAWANEANALLKERGSLVHGGFLGRWEGNKVMPAYIAHKGGEVIDIDLVRLDGLVECAGRLAAQGRDYSRRTFGEFIERLGGDYHRE